MPARLHGLCFATALALAAGLSPRTADAAPPAIPSPAPAGPSSPTQPSSLPDAPAESASPDAHDAPARPRDASDASTVPESTSDATSARPATTQVPLTGKWHPNYALATAGGIIFGAGYVPLAAPGFFSTLGAVARVGLVVFTLGIAAIPCINESDSYVCSGQHGSFKFLVPIAGPLLYAETPSRDTLIRQSRGPMTEGSRQVLYASAGVQAAGATLLLGSVLLGTRTMTDSDGKTHEERDTASNLVVFGGLVAGMSYGPSLLASLPSVLGFGAENHGGSGAALLAVPILGPFALAANNLEDHLVNPNGNLGPIAKGVLYADGIAQAVGITALTAGALMRPASRSATRIAKEPRPSGGPGSAAKGEGVKVSVLPMFQPGTFGVSASVVGW